MNEHPSMGIPPLAGLATYEEAARPGFSVDRNVDLMRRCNYVEKRLFEICAAFMNPTPEWEVKGALSLHMYLDSEHSQSLRARVSELRKPPLFLDQSPDPKLESLMEEALRANSTVELLTGLFRILRPALADAYRNHLAETNPVFDFPTCRVMRIALQEEEQMIEWGERALAALTKNDASRAEADAWSFHLNAYLQAAGGIAGAETTPEIDLPATRAAEPFIPQTEPKRDWRSADIHNFHYRANDVYLDAAADLDERNLAIMYKRFHEMDVPEMMASILLETKGKPWEYYRDMARQLWDEARHSMMGEVWLAKYGIDWSRYPNHVGWALHLNLDRSALDRHIILYYIEQNLMDRETGKRLEWIIAQQAGDPLATFFQDYDWADEVLHSQIGRRWLKPEFGDTKALLARAREVAAMPAPSMDALAATTPQLDWWPRFVLDVLGKESTSVAGTENGIVPTFTYVSQASG